MNIYFAASTQLIDKQLEDYRHIISCLQKQGVTVLNTWVVEAVNGVKAKTDSRAMLHREHALLLQADAVVAEVATPSLGVGAMLMLGVEQHKPILCLYPDSANEADISESVKGLVSSLVTTSTYNASTLKASIQKFLKRVENEQFQKFNFIASKKITDFIEEHARREQKTKSEFLRDFISGYIDDYTQHSAKEESVKR